MSFWLSAMSGTAYAYLCKVVIGHFEYCVGFFRGVQVFFAVLP